MLALTIAICTVILVSAFCSLLEAVLYSVPISRIEAMANNGSKKGRILKKLRENVDQPITAILSLNTIANTAGAAVTGALAVSVFGEQWLVYFSAGLTLAILLFSEIIPKTVGVTYSRSLAGFITRPLQFLIFIFRPLVWMCLKITRMISRGNKEQPFSEEDLSALAHLGQKTGVLDKEQTHAIQNILELESKVAKDIMTPRNVLFTLAADLTVQEVHEQNSLLTYSRIPVYGKDIDDVVGIVYRRTILTAIADNKRDMKIEDLMKPVHFVVWNTSAKRLLQMYLQLRHHMFVVINEFGGLTGVVTLEDVLEEILGREIVDEFDQVRDLRELARERRKEILEKYQGGE